MISAIIGKFISPIMPYLLIGFITTTTVLTLLLHYSNKKYDALVIDAATKIERSELNVINLRANVAEQKISIERLLIEKGETRARIERQNEFLAELQNSLNEERQKNEDYKTRWTNVAYKRPTLLARLANRATHKRVQFFSASTCRANCDKDSGSEDSGGTTKEARPDP